MKITNFTLPNHVRTWINCGISGPMSKTVTQLKARPQICTLEAPNASGVQGFL